MFPAFLITLREVIEASLIVATILAVLVKLKQVNGVRTVGKAVTAATAASVLLFAGGTFLGIQVQEVYKKNEEYIEGVLMITSAFFITWAVFFLHTYFSSFKVHLLHKIKKSIESQEQKGLFILVFVAVFREGFEIVLFLASIYISANPQEIATGCVMGLIGGLLISLTLFKTTLQIPVQSAFKTTSVLLILFAAGLLARGVHEFAEVGLLPEIGKMTFTFIPQKGVFVADMLKAIFGITQKMDFIQLSVYGLYVVGMCWYVFGRKTPLSTKRG